MKGVPDYLDFVSTDNDDHRKQIDAVNTFTLIAKRYNVPKDVRLLIAQKYIWDDTIPKKLTTFMQKLLMKPYYDESIKSPLTFFLYVIAQMLGIMLAGAFVYLMNLCDFSGYTRIAFIIICVLIAFMSKIPT